MKVLVTGVAGFIGMHCAQRLAARGDEVVGLDNLSPYYSVQLKRDRLKQLPIRFHELDIANASDLKKIFEEAKPEAVLHLAAQPGVRYSLENPAVYVETNLVGTYRTIRATQPHLAAGPDTRHVVVMSSILARFGVPSHTGYCASKAGLLGLVRALAHELAGANVQVNALCPGWVATDMAWRGIDALAKSLGTDRAGGFAEAMSHVPLGRMSEPEDVAGLVAWLVSADARGVTGQTIDMNNGAWM